MAERAARSRPAAGTDELAPELAAFNDAVPDDRPVPALGVGDAEAAAALVQATRLMLTARTPQQVVAAVAGFAVQLGGRLVPAARDAGSALPLDIALGTGVPVLVDADAPSVARMRLEQYLPGLPEDARVTTSRLRYLQDVEAASSLDPLTGLLSRREVMRQGATLGVGDVVCLVDVDNFRSVNSADGHAGGDSVLRALGHLIRDAIRVTDCAGRYGGDELVVLQRSVAIDVAARRIREIQQRWRAAGSAVTFSAGVAGIGAGGWPAALAAADTAMYAAKERGRDRTCVQGELPG
ncbi:MAG: hypothetical protein QOE05_150 [Actinomycetota bacterium]|jgi:diguanylate cyclase (GGDEF)-like protein|nr:hypothetical protein [Actinomycetota bacterium]